MEGLELGGWLVVGVAGFGDSWGNLETKEGVMSREARIARRLVGDFGDTQAFFNVFDYFDVKDEVTAKVLEAMRVLEKVVESESAEMGMLVRKELKRRQRELDAKGLVLK